MPSGFDFDAALDAELEGGWQDEEYQDDDRRAMVDGVVDSVVYSNEQTGYAVFRLTVDGRSDTVTVTGSLPYIGAGESVTVWGEWYTHPSYGEQFKAETAERTMPSTETAILFYLSGGNVSGVGPATARRIVERFGNRAFDVLENEPEELAKLPGFSLRKALTVSENFGRQLGVRRLMERLMTFGIHPSVALMLYKWYGNMAADFVSKNPYILTDENLGVDFSVADNMALTQGFSEDSSERCEAGIAYTLEHNLKNGHVFIPCPQLVDATARMLGVAAELCRTAVDNLAAKGSVVREEVDGREAVYLRRLHEAESETATRLRGMAKNLPEPPPELEQIIASTETEQGIEYAPLQREAIRVAATSRVMLLTGGPGTGKSTSVRGMLAVLDRMGLRCSLCSPTGRASKRLSQLAGRDAVTIHRLLEVGFGDGMPGFNFVHNADNRLETDAVILDETSMVDITLLAALVEALPPDARLIMVGDADQLPSVGPGAVLSDMIDCGEIATVRLSEIFRQAMDSHIVAGAHAVNKGLVPDLSHKAGDLFFIHRNGAQNVADTVVDLCARRLPDGMGYDPATIQVLSPTRRGIAGTINLNKMLQQTLNPAADEKKERRIGDSIFRVGDRVMHTRNNYDLQWQSASGAESGMGVFNGDIGNIEDIDTKGETVLVRYDDRYVYYSFDLLDQLELAYAMTVHKSQGSEYPAVVLVTTDASPQLLTRPVFYTAMTRAQMLLVMVGSEGIVAEMVHNNRRARRYSGFRARLKG